MLRFYYRGDEVFSQVVTITRKASGTLKRVFGAVTILQGKIRLFFCFGKKTVHFFFCRNVDIFHLHVCKSVQPE